MNDPLLLMTFGFLLPLVPAFILYRLLPSDIKVGGPFHGLNLQLSGAFGGYFLLTVMAFVYIKSIPKPVTDDLWEVHGRVACQSGLNVNQLRVRVQPPNYELPSYDLPNGELTLRVPAKLDSFGKLMFPTLLIEGAGEEINNLTIDLNEDSPTTQGGWKLDKNQAAKAISVKDIPTLQKKSPFNPPGPAPPQVSPPSGSEVPR